MGVEHVEPFRADHSELLLLVVKPNEPLLEVQELHVHSEDVLLEAVIAKDSLRSDVVLRTCCTVSHPAYQNITNAEVFDGRFALAGSCNGMSDLFEFVSSSSHVKSTIGTNLAPLVSISLFVLWRETLALVETFGVTLYCQTIAQVNAQTQRCQFVVVGSVVPAVLR